MSPWRYRSIASGFILTRRNHCQCICHYFVGNLPFLSVTFKIGLFKLNVPQLYYDSLGLDLSSNSPGLSFNSQKSITIGSSKIFPLHFYDFYLLITPSNVLNKLLSTIFQFINYSSSLSSLEFTPSIECFISKVIFLISILFLHFKYTCLWSTNSLNLFIFSFMYLCLSLTYFSSLFPTVLLFLFHVTHEFYRLPFNMFMFYNCFVVTFCYSLWLFLTRALKSEIY